MDRLRKLAYEDIDAALGEALGMSLAYIRERGGEAYHDTVEAYRWYSGER